MLSALDLDLMDQAVEQPLAGWGRPIGRDTDLLGEVGQLLAAGRMDGGDIQSRVEFVLADAQFGDELAGPAADKP